MKTIITGALVLAAAWVRADVSMTFSPDLVIPEGSHVGVVDSESFTLGPADGTVGGIALSLDTTGGYNGDLYAYLVAPNGTLVTLMDEPGTAVDGFGAASSGMNIVLGETGPSIQDVIGGAGTTLAGMYQPLDSLSAFNGALANGTWSIFFADLGDGGGSPELDSWTLDVDFVEPVPEPVNTALGIFLGAWFVGVGTRRLVSRMRT
jgi:subtilisin-like proprotein convertase family protein